MCRKLIKIVALITNDLILFLCRIKCFISLFHFISTPQFLTPFAFYTLHAFCCMFAMYLGHVKGKLVPPKLTALQTFLHPCNLGLSTRTQNTHLYAQKNDANFLQVQLMQNVHIMERTKILVIQVNEQSILNHDLWISLLQGLWILMKVPSII